MAPRMHDPDTCQNLNGNYVSVLSYHPVTNRQTREHSARFCLGESPGFKYFDLCYSFKTLVRLEYGSVQRLHEAAWNYQNNRAKVFGTGPDVQMLYEKSTLKSHRVHVRLLHRCLRVLWSSERPPGYTGVRMLHSGRPTGKVSPLVQTSGPSEARGHEDQVEGTAARTPR